ncbi:hypothetical protein FJTKL_11667 [Diaporthe vaccinii]|uniref:Uncharacterized protein n=1 Tax=Diaporthe vaccinii TaxID=105482 RepID=A0ABR4EFP9_9PEZI
MKSVVQIPDWSVISQIRIIVNSISAAERWVAAVCCSTGNSSAFVKADVIVRMNAMGKARAELDSAVRRILKLLHNIHNDGLIDNERYESSVGEVNFGLFRVSMFSCGFSNYWFI